MELITLLLFLLPEPEISDPVQLEGFAKYCWILTQKLFFLLQRQLMKNLPEYFNCRMVCPVFSFVFRILKWARNSVTSQYNNVTIKHKELWQRILHWKWHTAISLDQISAALQTSNIWTNRSISKQSQYQRSCNNSSQWVSVSRSIYLYQQYAFCSLFPF